MCLVTHVHHRRSAIAVDVREGIAVACGARRGRRASRDSKRAVGASRVRCASTSAASCAARMPVHPRLRLRRRGTKERCQLIVHVREVRIRRVRCHRWRTAAADPAAVPPPCGHRRRPACHPGHSAPAHGRGRATERHRRVRARACARARPQPAPPPPRRHRPAPRTAPARGPRVAQARPAPAARALWRATLRRGPPKSVRNLTPYDSGRNVSDSACGARVCGRRLRLRRGRRRGGATPARWRPPPPPSRPCCRLALRPPFPCPFPPPAEDDAGACARGGAHCSGAARRAAPPETLQPAAGGAAARGGRRTRGWRGRRVREAEGGRGDRCAH